MTDTPMPTVRLSKSRVMAGLQCHKLLWWMVHQREAPELELDERTSAVMDRGERVGELARTYVPGGHLIDVPHDAYAERLAATEEALRKDRPAIYEAAFRAEKVFVSVDILERRSAGYGLIEVKSTTSVKNHHLWDVAVQAHVLRRSGLDVTRMEVMHLNRECTYPDLSNLFVRQDVTEAVEGLIAKIPGEIEAQIAMLTGELPSVTIGDHCSAPYECPFVGRCWPELPLHHVSTLYAMRQRAWELDEQGYPTIYDLPEDLTLSPIAERQRRAVRTGQIVVEPGLTWALEAFVPPLAFLDFETVALAIPVWNGCHPYDSVPVQFSCHVISAEGQVTHHEWLADRPGDLPRGLAESVVKACAGARTVVAYNAPFERACLQHLAVAVPGLTEPLTDVVDRLTDLLPIVRNYVYHPDFSGSFGLKSVLPALVPELRYDDLSIANGATASLELERLLFGFDPPEWRARVRRDLLVYCQRDTLGLLKILERLRRVVSVADECCSC